MEDQKPATVSLLLPTVGNQNKEHLRAALLQMAKRFPIRLISLA